MKEQVLIVEDEENTVELLQYNLLKNGYSVAVARNGEDALVSAQSSNPDLVLLDVMLPVMDGWEVCRVLRERSKDGNIPIIMLTALDAEECRVKGLTLGADDYLTKPFSIKELMCKIDRHITRHRQFKDLCVREQEQDASLQYLIHELKNAVCVIGAYSNRALSLSDPASYLRTINLSAAHAESVLNDASFLSRLEREQYLVFRDDVDISEATSEAAELFRESAADNSIEIIVAERPSGIVAAETRAVRQVLINLLSNAVKYNRDNGKIWVNFDEDEDWIDVSITDEGRGIAEAEQDNIFRKFYRVPGSQDVKGSGLGLYIVKLLMDAMQGKISVISCPGIGTTFTASWRKKNSDHILNLR